MELHNLKLEYDDLIFGVHLPWKLEVVGSFSTGARVFFRNSSTPFLFCKIADLESSSEKLL